MKRKVVIISDCRDIAYLEMRQTIVNNLTEEVCENVEIEPLVGVENFSVVHAAFSLRLLVELYPPGTIFMIVVSGLASSPDRVYGKFKNGSYFIGNNSGYLNWTVDDLGLESIYANNKNYAVDPRAFGGKYVHAPTAAGILNGLDLNTFGEKRDASFLGDFSIKKGTLVHIDNFGLMKLYNDKITNLVEGQVLRVSINGKYVIDAIYTRSMKNHPDGTFVISNGSSLHLMPEIACVRKHAAQELNSKVGDLVEFEVKE
jgi:S-adenosylmethionine hydrolase